MIIKAVMSSVSTYLTDKQVHLIPPLRDRNQQKGIIAKGALAYLKQHGPVRQNNLLRPRNGRDLMLITNLTEEGKLAALARDTNPGFVFTPIDQVDQFGQIAADALSVKLVETLSNLGPFMAGDQVADVYQQLLAECPAPSTAYKKQLKDFWQHMFHRCYRVLLDLPINGPAGPKPDETAQALLWRYQTIRAGEAKFTVGAHKYWLSTGLSDTQK